MNREFLESLGIEVANEGDEEILFKCPFHDDNTPSASYNITDRVYNCFVCGGGSLKSLAQDLGFEMKAEMIDRIPPSLEGIQRDLNAILNPNTERNNYFLSEFEKIEYEIQCPEYLLERIDFETVQEFNLHICDNEKSLYNERIIFPLHSKSNIGFIARDYTEVKPQKYLFPKNMPKQEFLFGKMESDEVILVEGVFDVMKLWENGYKNCVCPSGVVFSEEQASLLIENGIKSLTLLPDGDEAGKEFIKKMESFVNIFDINIANQQTFYIREGKDPFDLTKEDIDFAIKHKFNLREKIWESEKYKIFDGLP